MPRRYHPLLVALHWIVALLILTLLAFGTFSLAPTPNSDPAKILSFRAHMALGLSVLVLMILRLVVRWRTAQPAPVDSGNALLNRIAPAAHWALYALALAMAGSGMALSAASGLPDAVFGDAALPEDFRDFAARRVHGLVSRLLALVVLLHVLAALWHQFVRRDGLMARMWFGPR